jgi:hypothetical protein
MGAPGWVPPSPVSLVTTGVADAAPAVPQPEVSVSPHESTFDLEALLRENLGALYRYSLPLSRGSPDRGPKVNWRFPEPGGSSEEDPRAAALPICRRFRFPLFLLAL